MRAVTGPGLRLGLRQRPRVGRGVECDRSTSARMFRKSSGQAVIVSGHRYTAAELPTTAPGLGGGPNRRHRWQQL